MPGSGFLLCQKVRSKLNNYLRPDAGSLNYVHALVMMSQWLTKFGPSANPYDKTFDGVDIPKTEVDEEQPYHDLDPKRLKLFGTGHWDATEFLSEELVMAYREPRSLLRGLASEPGPFIRESPRATCCTSKGMG